MDGEQQVQVGVFATILCFQIRPHREHHGARRDLAVEVRDRLPGRRAGLLQQG